MCIPRIHPIKSLQFIMKTPTLSIFIPGKDKNDGLSNLLWTRQPVSSRVTSPPGPACTAHCTTFTMPSGLSSHDTNTLFCYILSVMLRLYMMFK